MIDKPDPAKDAGRTDAPGAKRPHATLDLKATEVKSPAPQTPAASASAASADKATPSAPSPATSAGAASSSGSPAEKTAGTAGPSARPAASAAPKAEPAAKAAPRTATRTTAATSGAGGFLSHLAAGVIGGALVYAGAAFVGPEWLPGTATDSDLAARIAAVEARSESADVSALASKIGDAESRLAKLDELERSVAALGEAQRTLEAEARSLSETAQRGDGAGSDERLAKLEEQLRMIAAGSGAENGGTPQLAAVTAKISDVETSLAAAREAGEAVKSAAVQLERELSQIRTEQARGTQRIDAARADVDRLAAIVEAANEETGRLSGALSDLRSSVDSQLKSFAKPADVTAAVGPVNSKLAELEQSIQSVIRNEQSRRLNAERIVLSLELSNLKRALDRGQGHGYAAELEEVRKASAGQLDLSSLERFKDVGVATVAQIRAEFRPLVNAVLDADLDSADGSVIDRLLAGAKSVVRVRKVSHDPDDTSTEALVARIETALDEGRLGDVLAHAKALPPRARIPLEDWLVKVTARDTVDRAIAEVESGLKASLSGAAEPEPAAPAPAQN